MPRVIKNRLVGENIHNDVTWGLPLFVPSGDVERDASMKQLDEEKLTKSRRAVYDVFRLHGSMNDRQASLKSKIPVNIITARRHELVEMGYIVGDGTAWDIQTERNVNMWKVKR